jgi:fructose-bisphosphate aldolase, class II
VTRSSARDLVTAAAAAGRAVPAFNVISLESAEAIVTGAERANTGVLLQLSENAIAWHGGALEPLVAACSELAASASVAVGIHVDHFEDRALVDHAIGIAERYGIGSLMFDASREPYESNAALTAAVVDHAHANGLWIEAELGEVGGKDGAHAPGVRTDPTEAAAFVAATGIDALAVAVGSSHAMTDRSASLDVDLIRALAASVPVPLVLHGSSGVSDAGIAEAVAAGIRKINVGTALNLAWTSALRASLAGDPAVSDPRRYSKTAREDVAALVEHLCGVIAG